MPARCLTITGNYDILESQESVAEYINTFLSGKKKYVETSFMSRFLLPILLLAIFVSFFRLGSVTLFDVDEAVFSQATKEMVESGNWMTPTYNGEKRYDKPILFYWLMAASYNILGINEFGARFPSAVAACVLICALFFL